MSTPDLFTPERPRSILAPGAVHVPNWLDYPAQEHLVGACRLWAEGPVPMQATRLPRGGVMSVKTVCLGWHWQPYHYTRTSEGQPVTPLPDWLITLGQKAVADAYQDPSAGANYHPDAVLVNYYDNAAHMGMHQDKDETTNFPVVSLSLGDACLFRLGNSLTRTKPYQDVRLESGDLFVFGGESRFAYHGVPKVYPNTGPVGLLTGRLNLTMRVTGLSG